MNNTDGLVYEDWLSVNPQLLWAIERKIDTANAQRMGSRLTSYDQTAWYIIEGKAVVKNARGEVSAGPGQWIMPAHGERLQEFDGPLWFYSVNFRAKWWDAKPLFPIEQSIVLDGKEFPAMEVRAKDVCDQIFQRLGKESWYLGVHRCSLADWVVIQRLQAEWLEIYVQAMSMLGVSAYCPSKVDPRFQQAQQLMERHRWSDKFTVEDLAAKVGLSRRQLERIYQDSVERSPLSVFDEIKVSHAKKLLLNPNLLIKEIAYEMGFGDISNFNRWFYRLTKIKPGTFRETNRSGL